MKRIRCRSRGASFRTTLMQYSVLALLVTFGSALNAQQGCIAPTESFSCVPKAASVGDSVWEIADRIQAVVGGATDVASATIDEVHIIDQTVIPFQITESGRFKLCEDITAPSAGNFAIQIRAANVYLDLNGHTITKDAHSGNSTRNIIDINGAANVIVENGALNVNLGQLGATSSATMNGIRSLNSQSVVIRNVSFTGIDTDFFTIPAGYTENAIRIAGSNGVLISNVQTRIGTYSIDISNSSHIQASRVISIAPRAATVTAATGQGLWFDAIQSAFSGGSAYNISGCTNVLFTNCNAENSSLSGFNIVNSDIVYTVGCCAQQCGTSSSDTPPGVCYAAFSFDAQSTLFGAIDCTASSCPGAGFNLATDGTVYRCTAAMGGSQCPTTGYGFSVTGQGCWFANNLSDQNAPATDFNGVDSNTTYASTDIDDPMNVNSPRFWSNVDR